MEPIHIKRFSSDLHLGLACYQRTQAESHVGSSRANSDEVIMVDCLACAIPQTCLQTKSWASRLVWSPNSFRYATAMSESIETPSRTDGYASAQLCNSLLDKKGAGCTLISIPSVRSLEYFKRLSTLISWEVSTSMFLSFVTSAARHHGKVSELGDTSIHGSVFSNEAPIDGSSVLLGSICL